MDPRWCFTTRTLCLFATCLENDCWVSSYSCPCSAMNVHDPEPDGEIVLNRFKQIIESEQKIAKPAISPFSHKVPQLLCQLLPSEQAKVIKVIPKSTKIHINQSIFPPKLAVGISSIYRFQVFQGIDALVAAPRLSHGSHGQSVGSRPQRRSVVVIRGG